jgi:hypothetical protein
MMFTVLCAKGAFPLRELQEFFGMFREEIIETLNGLNIELAINPPVPEATQYKRIASDGIYIIDHVTFDCGPKPIDRNLMEDLYREKNLSTAQVAKELGCSKTLVITTLKRMGYLRPVRGSQTSLTNYRHRVPPYGFRVTKGRLHTYRKELKLCRLIVELVGRRGMSFKNTALHLEKNGFRSRKEEVKWHNYTVSRIFLSRPRYPTTVSSHILDDT